MNSSKIKTKDLVITGMFAALICVISPFSIPTQPVPFTMSLFAIFLTGAVLQPRFALLASIVYLAIGAFGVPVFSGFGSGPDKLFGLTGGYLISYPLMAFIIALAFKYIKKFKTLALIGGMLIALFVCYMLGTLWFVHLSGNSISKALGLCVFPYIPLDLVKIALATSVGLALRKTGIKNYDNQL